MDELFQKLYSPSLWNKRLPVHQVVNAHGEFLVKNSELAKKTLNSYVLKFSDSDPEQTIEIIYSGDDFKATDNYLNFNNNKILIYIHGGYWQWGSVKSSSFMAQNFAAKKVIIVALGYTIAPQASMSEIFSQTERAVAKILEYSNNSEVFVCGHSAGGHLASMLLFTDFERKYNINSKNLIGLIPVSGIFDLNPLLKTDINDNLKMNENESALLSPLLRNDPLLSKKTKILIAYAENDSPAFHKQSIDFQSWLNKFGYNNVTCVRIDDSDHFDIIENISQDEFSLTKDASTNLFFGEFDVDGS